MSLRLAWATGRNLAWYLWGGYKEAYGTCVLAHITPLIGRFFLFVCFWVFFVFWGFFFVVVVGLVWFGFFWPSTV